MLNDVTWCLKRLLHRERQRVRWRRERQRIRWRRERQRSRWRRNEVDTTRRLLFLEKVHRFLVKYQRYTLPKSFHRDTEAARDKEEKTTNELTRIKCCTLLKLLEQLDKNRLAEVRSNGIATYTWTQIQVARLCEVSFATRNEKNFELCAAFSIGHDPTTGSMKSNLVANSLWDAFQCKQWFPTEI